MSTINMATDEESGAVSQSQGEKPRHSDILARVTRLFHSDAEDEEQIQGSDSIVGLPHIGEFGHQVAS